MRHHQQRWHGRAAAFLTALLWSALMVRPDVVRGQGVAGAPTSGSDLESSVAAMARVGFAASPSFSPDGRRVAFVSNLSGLPQVWTVAASGGFPRQVTALADPVQSVAWSPVEESDWLAITVAPGGGMNVQVYLVKPDGTGLTRVTDGGKETNRLAGWSRDGRMLLLGSNRDNPRAIDGYLYDVAAGGPMRLVVRNEGVGGLIGLSRDSRRGLVSRVESRGDSNLFLLDVATGALTLLTPHRGPGTFDGELTADGSTVYLRSDLDSDLAAFARIRIDGAGKPGPIEVIAARDDADLEAFAVSRDDSTAALVWNEAGRSAVTIVDLSPASASWEPSASTPAAPFGVGIARSPPADGVPAAAHAPAPSSFKSTPVRDLPAEIVGGVVFSNNARRLALTASGAATPRDVWVLDRAQMRFTRLTESPHPGVDLASLVRPELVRFPAHDGLELSGWLYRPIGSSGAVPMVLSFHGGPEGQERPFFNATYQALLARGIGVFAPNVRGSSGFGKRFVNLDNGALRHDGVRDLETCARWAVASGHADPKRLGIMGGSYGGYMTMAGLTRYPDLFAAGANLFGVVNFETFFANTEPWMAAISTVEYGDPVRQKDLLRELSPIHAVDRVEAPTLVLHGANDTNVPVVEAEQVVERLRKRAIPVEYILFPDEGHGFVRLENRIRSAVEIVHWFETHLRRPLAGTS
jgi:dipeptidyl aminopeptidase/acylaminoacyl peptidase